MESGNFFVSIDKNRIWLCAPSSVDSVVETRENILGKANKAANCRAAVLLPFVYIQEKTEERNLFRLQAILFFFSGKTAFFKVH